MSSDEQLLSFCINEQAAPDQFEIKEIVLDIVSVCHKICLICKDFRLSTNWISLYPVNSFHKSWREKERRRDVC